jgi:hypothetical protein
MVLAALRRVRCAETGHVLTVARRFLTQSRSAGALNWLRIELLTHGRPPGGVAHQADWLGTRKDSERLCGRSLTGRESC